LLQDPRSKSLSVDSSKSHASESEPFVGSYIGKWLASARISYAPVDRHLHVPSQRVSRFGNGNRGIHASLKCLPNLSHVTVRFHCLKKERIVEILSRLNAPQISRMSPLIPNLRHATYDFLPVRDHMAQIPLALALQSLVPQVGGVSDDPIEALFDDPVEVGSVVVSLCRLVGYETV
jgi:hypothetical protein